MNCLLIPSIRSNMHVSRARVTQKHKVKRENIFENYCWPRVLFAHSYRRRNDGGLDFLFVFLFFNKIIRGRHAINFRYLIKIYGRTKVFVLGKWSCVYLPREMLPFLCILTRRTFHTQIKFNFRIRRFFWLGVGAFKSAFTIKTFSLD